MCKCGNALSLPVLIDRVAWPQNKSHKTGPIVRRISRKQIVRHSKHRFSVAIAKGSHPFPSRTRKLSPSAPMVLPGKLGGRVGRRRNFFQNPESKIDSGFLISCNWIISGDLDLYCQQSDNTASGCLFQLGVYPLQFFFIRFNSCQKFHFFKSVLSFQIH